MKNLNLLIITVLLHMACSENGEPTLVVIEKEEVKAMNLVNAYLDQHTKNERTTKGQENIAVIVLKYENDQLLYASSQDGFSSYEVIEEKTITATVNSNGMVFWYAGEAVQSLSTIEFDSKSQSLLNELPFDIHQGSLIGLTIPENEGMENLKYDVVFSYIDSTGKTYKRRIDPLIKISSKG